MHLRCSCLLGRFWSISMCSTYLAPTKNLARAVLPSDVNLHGRFLAHEASIRCTSLGLLPGSWHTAAYALVLVTHFGLRVGYLQKAVWYGASKQMPKRPRQTASSPNKSAYRRRPETGPRDLKLSSVCLFSGFCMPLSP